MAVSIRLRREGAKNRPYYRVVVADKRSPRDGKFIEVVGTYDPRQPGENYALNLERTEYWLKHGAQPSETVASFIRKARRKAKTAAAAAAAAGEGTPTSGPTGGSKPAAAATPAA
ncbi:MAG: 30S ribosomal protein S16 [Verrucomicrobia bacterium]|nr:30S ribosomal protein S16 [Verrucomicrobiota bacterium]